MITQACEIITRCSTVTLVIYLTAARWISESFFTVLSFMKLALKCRQYCTIARKYKKAQLSLISQRFLRIV